MNIKHKKEVLLFLKSIICSLSLISGSMVLSGCESSKDDYYIVTDGGKNYICTRRISDNDDYEFTSIKDNKIIGYICLNNGSFDYSMKKHSFNKKFLCELQVFSLKDALADENIDISLIDNSKDVVDLAFSSNLDNIVNNHYVRELYSCNEDFVYIPDSKLQLFVDDNCVRVGYDVSPDRIMNNNRYVYSIYDRDVIEYKKTDNVLTYSVNMYMTDDNKSDGYISHNDALRMIKKYKKNHFK